MNRQSIVFKKPFEIEIIEEPLPEIGPADVLVQTKYSAISRGTEMLVYRGLFPHEVAVDEMISGLDQPLRYPLKYGYTTIGTVLQVGSEVGENLVGRMVFSLHPHESCFVAGPDDLIAIPQDINALDAIFLAAMETAVNFLMDGRPIIGEKAVVFGQGVVGLLTAALLAQFPLAALLTLDNYPLRRDVSVNAGAHLCLDPAEPGIFEQAIRFLEPNSSQGSADLIYELSGNPQALNLAIALCGFDARIVIGSWYGKQRAEFELGGRFHRKRIRLVSSQVSTLTPALCARWTRQRRFKVAWDMIRRIRPARFITHRFAFTRVKEAFELLDKDPAAALQVVLDYDAP